MKESKSVVGWNTIVFVVVIVGLMVVIVGLITASGFGWTEICRFVTSNTAILLVGGGIVYWVVRWSRQFRDQESAVRRDLSAFRELLSKEGEEWDAVLNQTEELKTLRPAIEALADNLEPNEGDLGRIPASKPLLTMTPVEEHFNVDTVYHANIESSFFRAVPGILTGLGLLFTFVGLAAGIYLAYNVGEEESRSIAINQLLSGAGQAFLSSIVGLIGSIAFQIRMRMTEDKIFKEINAVVATLYRRIHLLTPERLQYETLRQLTEQNAKVDQLGERWNLKMEEVFDRLLAEQEAMKKDLVDRLVLAIEKVNIALEKMSESQIEHILAMLEKASNAFSDKLAQRIEDMTEDFSKTAKDLNAAGDVLRGVFDRINERVEEASAATEASLENVRKEFDRIEACMREGGVAVAGAFENAVQKVDAMSETVTKAGDGICTALDASSAAFGTTMAGTAEAFKQTTDASAAGFAEAMTAATGSLTESADGFKTTMSGVTEEFRTTLTGTASAFKQTTDASTAGFTEAITRTTEGFRQSLVGTAETFRDIANGSANGFRKAVVEAGEGFRDNVAAAVNSVEALLVAFEAQAEKERDLVVKIDMIGSSLTKQADVLSVMIESLKGNEATWTELIRQLADEARASTESAKKTHETVSQELQYALQQMIEQARELTSQQRDITETAEKLQKLTDEHLTELAKSLKAVHEQVNRILSETDNGLASAVGSMSEALGEWIDHQQDVNAVMSENIRVLGDAMARKADDLEKVLDGRITAVDQVLSKNTLTLRSALEQQTAELGEVVKSAVAAGRTSAKN